MKTVFTAQVVVGEGDEEREETLEWQIDEDYDVVDVVINGKLLFSGDWTGNLKAFITEVMRYEVEKRIQEFREAIHKEHALPLAGGNQQ